MKSISSAFRCAQRSTEPTAELVDWAESVAVDPAAHGATAREAAIVAALLAELKAGR